MSHLMIRSQSTQSNANRRSRLREFAIEKWALLAA
jgi:hypothetical protein